MANSVDISMASRVSHTPSWTLVAEWSTWSGTTWHWKPRMHLRSGFQTALDSSIPVVSILGIFRLPEHRFGVESSSRESSVWARRFAHSGCLWVDDEASPISRRKVAESLVYRGLRAPLFEQFSYKILLRICVRSLLEKHRLAAPDLYLPWSIQNMG